MGSYDDFDDDDYPDPAYDRYLDGPRMCERCDSPTISVNDAYCPMCEELLGYPPYVPTEPA